MRVSVRSVGVWELERKNEEERADRPAEGSGATSASFVQPFEDLWHWKDNRA